MKETLLILLEKIAYDRDIFKAGRNEYKGHTYKGLKCEGAYEYADRLYYFIAQCLEHLDYLDKK